jgi:gluconate kinase
VTAILITGNPGSGKSSLASELARRGCAVIDGDDIAGWETTSGEPATQPVPTPDDWWHSHRWVWSRSRVEAVISERSSATRPLFVCGITVNQRDMLDLFDRVFLLTLDHRTQVERLNAPSNAHRTAAARAQILTGRPVFEAEMQAAGAIVLDGRQPTPILASRILDDVDSRQAGTRANTRPPA